MAPIFSVAIDGVTESPDGSATHVTHNPSEEGTQKKKDSVTKEGEKKRKAEGGPDESLGEEKVLAMDEVYRQRRAQREERLLHARRRSKLVAFMGESHEQS